MNLKTFLDMLVETELSQHVFGSLDEDEVLVKKYELINLINRGLENLHTRFVIKKGEVRINIANNHRYRHDISDEDFVLTPDHKRNVIKVLEIWDEKGHPCRFNTHHRSMAHHSHKESSIQMVDNKTLIFEHCEGCYKIIFHAGPELIVKPETLELFQPENIELDISLEYIDALIYYVASRLFSVTLPMEGNAAQYSPGILYSAKFEQECQRLKELNFEIEGIGDSSQRFHSSMFP
jgi:hypothetical protein